MRLYEFLPLLASLLALLPSSVTTRRSPARIVCYYTNWSVYRKGSAKFNPQNINPYLCTHLIYAFGGLSNDFELKPFDKYQDVEQGGFNKFIGLKSYNKGLKVLLALGGWNEGSKRWSELVADAENRRRFILSAIRFMRINHFDGLDLDWEYPAFRDGGVPEDRDNYATLVKELRAEFEREHSKTNRPKLLLTMAVPAGTEYIDKGYDIVSLNRNLDWFNILAYDYHSAFEPQVNHHAPLFSTQPDSEYNYEGNLNVDYTVKYYIEKGASPDKLVVGIPTYGRSYTLINPGATDLGSPADGPGDAGPATREDGYMAFYEVCEKVALEGWSVRKPFPRALGPYAYKDNQWVGYDDEGTVKLKADYIKRNGLGGAMFWSIDNDDFRGICNGQPFPLIEAAKEVLFGKQKNTLKITQQESATTKAPQKTQEVFQLSRSRTPNRNRNKDSTTTERPETTTRRIPDFIDPLNTPPPPPTPDPGSDFTCKSEGFYKHPRECNKYFWCLDSGPSGLGVVAHLFTCPTGLIFNKAADSCDFSRNVICNTDSETSEGEKETTFTTPTPPPPTTPYSPDPDDIIYEDFEEEDNEPSLSELLQLIDILGGVSKVKNLLETNSNEISFREAKALKQIINTIDVDEKPQSSRPSFGGGRSRPQFVPRERPEEPTEFVVNRQERPEYTTIQRGRGSQNRFTEEIAEEPEVEERPTLTRTRGPQFQRPERVEIEVEQPVSFGNRAELEYSTIVRGGRTQGQSNLRQSLKPLEPEEPEIEYTNIRGDGSRPDIAPLEEPEREPTVVLNEEGEPAHIPRGTPLIRHPARVRRPKKPSTTTTETPKVTRVPRIRSRPRTIRPSATQSPIAATTRAQRTRLRVRTRRPSSDAETTENPETTSNDEEVSDDPAETKEVNDEPAVTRSRGRFRGTSPTRTLKRFTTTEAPKRRFVFRTRRPSRLRSSETTTEVEPVTEEVKILTSRRQSTSTKTSLASLSGSTAAESTQREHEINPNELQRKTGTTLEPSENEVTKQSSFLPTIDRGLLKDIDFDNIRNIKPASEHVDEFNKIVTGNNAIKQQSVATRPETFFTSSRPSIFDQFGPTENTAVPTFNTGFTPVVSSTFRPIVNPNPNTPSQNFIISSKQPFVSSTTPTTQRPPFQVSTKRPILSSERPAFLFTSPRPAPSTERPAVSTSFPPIPSHTPFNINAIPTDKSVEPLYSDEYYYDEYYYYDEEPGKLPSVTPEPFRSTTRPPVRITFEPRTQATRPPPSRATRPPQTRPTPPPQTRATRPTRGPQTRPPPPSSTRSPRSRTPDAFSKTDPFYDDYYYYYDDEITERSQHLTERTTEFTKATRPFRPKPRPPRPSTPKTNEDDVYEYDYINDDEFPNNGNLFVDYYNEFLNLDSKLRFLPDGRVQCLDSGVFPHPDSCKKFISCARMETGLLRGWIYQCPRDLVFDPFGGMCNWAESVDCSKDFRPLR